MLGPLLTPVDPETLARRADRRRATLATEVAAKRALERAMQHRDVGAVSEAILEYAHALIDGCRELIAAAELDFANNWLASHGATAAQLWPAQYTLAQIYERLGDPFRAICAAHGAKLHAEAAGAPDGVRLADHLLAALVPAA